jgi:ribonuclease D
MDKTLTFEDVFVRSLEASLKIILTVYAGRNRVAHQANLPPNLVVAVARALILVSNASPGRKERHSGPGVNPSHPMKHGMTMPATASSALTALRSLRSKEGLSAAEKELLEAVTGALEVLDQRLSALEGKDSSATAPIGDTPQGETAPLSR